MRVNMTQESKKDSLIAQMVLLALVQSIKDVGAFEKFLEGKSENNDYFLDVKVTIEGQEIDLQAFMKQWEAKVKKLVEQRAKDMVITRMKGINSILDEVQGKIDTAIVK